VGNDGPIAKMRRRRERCPLGCGIMALIAGAAWYFGSQPLSKATVAAERPPRIEVVTPRRTTVAQRLQSNATLEAFEETELFAKISGYVVQVRVDIGDHIKADEVLAAIDVPELEKELAEAEAQLESRKRSADSARRQVEHNKADLALQEATLKRQESLAGKGVGRYVTDQSLDEAKARAEVSRADLGVAESNLKLADAQVDVAAATVDRTKALLGYSKIVAPFDGVVSQRLVNRGDLVQAATSTRTTPLFKVHRIDIIRVFCDVPENEVAQVRVGDPATVKPIGLNGTQFTGTVTRFAARLDPQTRNMRTEIDLQNTDGRLYPGMYAEVALEEQASRRAYRARIGRRHRRFRDIPLCGEFRPHRAHPGKAWAARRRAGRGCRRAIREDHGRVGRKNSASARDLGHYQ
jgi:multidrug efflux pump subunit AcrA (membrane-fusion protein)